MAALNLQLPGLQENLNLSATPARAPDTDATTTPVNANVAQSSPAPLDTVTLAGQAAAGQGADRQTSSSADQNQARQSHRNNLVFAPNFLSNPASDQTADADTTNTSSQPVSQQTNPTGSGSANASASTQTLQGINGSGSGTQQSVEETQKQQLQQLDRTLRQLGIDPQSISVFNQLALLFFSNNPAGLKQFLTQFQQAAQQLLTQNSSSQAISQNLSSAAVTAAFQLGTPATDSADATAPGTATHTASGSLAVADANSAADEASIQFHDLQFAVAAVGGKLQMSATGSANLQTQGESLNVTF